MDYLFAVIIVFMFVGSILIALGNENVATIGLIMMNLAIVGCVWICASGLEA